MHAHGPPRVRRLWCDLPGTIVRVEPPYTAVLFTSRLTDDTEGYGEVADRMEALAAQQPGYLGFEGARGADGLGVSVSYWVDEAAAAAWKQVAEHLLAQREGRSRWYERYTVRVATVSRQYDGP